MTDAGCPINPPWMRMAILSQRDLAFLSSQLTAIARVTRRESILGIFLGWWPAVAIVGPALAFSVGDCWFGEGSGNVFWLTVFVVGWLLGANLNLINSGPVNRGSFVLDAVVYGVLAVIYLNGAVLAAGITWLQALGIGLFLASAALCVVSLLHRQLVRHVRQQMADRFGVRPLQELLSELKVMLKWRNRNRADVLELEAKKDPFSSGWTLDYRGRRWRLVLAGQRVLLVNIQTMHVLAVSREELAKDLDRLSRPKWNSPRSFRRLTISVGLQIGFDISDREQAKLCSWVEAGANADAEATAVDNDKQ